MKKTQALAAAAAALVLLGCARAVETAFATSVHTSLDRLSLADGFAAPEAAAFAAAFAEAFHETETAVAVPEQRMLVRRAELRLRVENLEQTGESVAALMLRHGAYPSFADITETSRRYIIRVPSDLVEPFLAELGGLGRVLNRIESAEDVSLRFFDMEGRLATQRKLLATFQSYLERATNIQEILSVEAHIADLQRQLDGTGRELRNLANLVEYSTVTLSLVGPAATQAGGGLTLSERFGRLFSGFGSFLSTAAVVAVGLVLYGVPVLAAVVLLYWLLLGRIGLLRKLFRAASDRPAK